MKRPEWMRLQSVASLISEDLRSAEDKRLSDKAYAELVACRFMLLARVEVLLQPDYSGRQH